VHDKIKRGESVALTQLNGPSKIKEKRMFKSKTVALVLVLALLCLPAPLAAQSYSYYESWDEYSGFSYDYYESYDEPYYYGPSYRSGGYEVLELISYIPRLFSLGGGCHFEIDD
jgi:hypothetical protein